MIAIDSNETLLRSLAASADAADAARRALPRRGAGRLAAAPPARRCASTSRRAIVQPMPIALPDFVGGSRRPTATSRATSPQVITGNLQAQRPVRADRSGRLHREDHQHRCGAALPRLARDQRAGAGHRPHDAPDRRPPEGGIPAVGRVRRRSSSPASNISPTPDNWRRIAHIISDAIYERLTGEKGYFDSRIVFVDETGPKDRRIKRLAIMDQDGANVRYLTRGDDLVLTPRFSPSTQEITYMSFGTARSARLSAQHRDRPARDRRQLPRHDLRAALLAGRPARDHEPAAGQQLQPVRDGSALQADDAAHRHAGDRHRAVLFAGRHAHLLRKRSRRLAADLCHGATGGSGASASASAKAPIRRRSGRRAATIIAFTKHGARPVLASAS